MVDLLETRRQLQQKLRKRTHKRRMRSSWQTHARSVHKMQSQSRQRAPQRPSKRRSVAAEKDKKEATGKELMATLEFISSLHAECDWLVQYYQVRKEGRAGEVESLQKAKAV